MRKTLFLFYLVIVSTSVAFSQKNDPVKDWKLSVQMWTFNKSTFVEGLDMAHTCGFKYIEAYPGQKLGGNFQGEIGPAMPEQERIALKALLKSKGISMIAFGVVDGVDDARTMEAWKKNFEFAREMGCEEMTVMPTAAQLDMVNKLAAEYHIRAAIHDEPGNTPYRNPDSVVVAISGRPFLGACVDMGNWARNGVNVVAAIQEQLKGRIFSVHLKDVKQAGVVSTPDVILGTGQANVAAVLKELKAAGFSGFLSLEHESDKVADLTAIKADVAFYKKVISGL